MRAEASSGRSEVVSSAFENFESPTGAGATMVSTAADPPSGADGNAAMRTVMTFLPSDDCTVWMALPA